MGGTQALHANLVESLLEPDVVKGLNILIAQLKSMGATATGSPLSSGGGSAPPTSSGASGTPQVNVSLPIPVSALEMVRSAIASGNLAHATPNTSRLPITVAAAGSHTFTNSPPKGYVWVLAAPLLVFSSQHQKGVLVSGVIDGQIIINDFAMVADAEEQIASYVAVTKSLKFTITNDTSQPVTITPEVQYAKVLNRIYYQRIKIVVEDGDALLDRYASAANLRLAQGGA